MLYRLYDIFETIYRTAKKDFKPQNMRFLAILRSQRKTYSPIQIVGRSGSVNSTTKKRAFFGFLVGFQSPVTFYLRIV